MVFCHWGGDVKMYIFPGKADPAANAGGTAKNGRNTTMEGKQEKQRKEDNCKTVEGRDRGND